MERMNNILDLRRRPCVTCGIEQYIITPTYQCLGCYVKKNKYPKEWTERKQVISQEHYEKLHNTITKNEAERLLHNDNPLGDSEKEKQIRIPVFAREFKQKK